MNVTAAAFAKQQDDADPIKNIRQQFLIPTRGQLRRKTLEASTDPVKPVDVELCTYLCGNSLGLQPKLISQYTAAYHETWATKGVLGHFTEIEDSPLAPWLDVDDAVAEDMGRIVGARKDEIAVMQTLTANLHFAMASFYRPTQERYKIIIESKAFPSDHFAIASQLQHHGINPQKGMITIEPRDSHQSTLTTEHILSVIDEHADSTAVLLLPGIQFYTGQFFDMPTITTHAQSKGIIVGWDLAHAVGNVPVQLHDWNIDFAIWCSYKYLNCGPGSIGGLFVHERHSQVSSTPSHPSTNGHTSSDIPTKPIYTPRLSGWWGSTKSTRFAMDNSFSPIPGAAGWQLSNPSVADLTTMRASLDVFKLASIDALRTKSLKLTGYLLSLLQKLQVEQGEQRKFEIITPLDEKARGAQLSLKLKAGLLDGVMKHLEEEGVVVDERRPDVIRVAPAPLYNTFGDCLRFLEVFGEALRRGGSGDVQKSVAVEGGKESKGWSEIK